jgi:hypothetical protein
VESATEAVDPLAPSHPTPEWTAGRPRLARAHRAIERVRFALLVYLGSRALLLAVGIVNGQLRHRSLLNELSNWDGFWYRAIANVDAAGPHGYFYQGGWHSSFYPHHVFHLQSNLGFFPGYPMLMWLVSHPVRWIAGHGPIWAVTVAGLLLSLVGGFIATVLVQRLASGWWGPDAGKRSVLLFCLFPGSVIFSMVYAEGVVIPLALGCILALQRRRWVVAGTLAGLATAGEPEAVVLILVCLVSAARYLQGPGRSDPHARRSLVAPALSVTGAAGVGIFFWAWTGTPFATFQAQHYGWGERTDALALVHLVARFTDQISFSHFNHPTINLNLPLGIAGTVVLIVGLWWLARSPRQISLEAWVWTLGISFLAVTSEYVPPNPRMLITAFPVVLVYAYRLRGRSFNWMLALNVVLLAGLSALTFHNVTLRP